MSGLDITRVAEVLVTRDTGETIRATGYRISDRAVLSAAHAIRPAASITVRFNADRPAEWQSSASVGWSRLSDRFDLAVLTLVDPKIPVDQDALFGSLELADDQLEASLAGFPLFKLRHENISADETSSYRDVAHERGSIPLLANVREGTLEVRVHPPEADPDPERSPWDGISGAAVWVDGAIVGVVNKHYRAEGLGRLTASRLDTMLGALDAAEIERLCHLIGPGRAPANVRRVGWNQAGVSKTHAEDSTAHARRERLNQDLTRLADPDDLETDRAVEPDLRTFGVVSHREFMSGLTGFRRYLSAETLPFVEPDPEHPAHPESVLRVLQTGERPHVLLVGPGGTGKTRTVMETAELADRAGWTVVHVMTDQPDTAAADVHRHVVAQKRSKALVIIDYLADVSGVDTRSIKNQLVPAAMRAGIHLAVLATARPGWAALHRIRLDEIFVTVPVRSDPAFQAKVVRRICQRVAPRAVQSLGMGSVVRRCGSRPTIALLVAKHIEESGDARPRDNSHHALELSSWLERRLYEDELLPAVPTSVWETPTRPPRLSAVATMVAAMPQQPDRLRAVGGRSVGSAEDVSEPQRLLEVLRQLGWIESRGESLSPVHDLVADELVRGSLIEATTGLVDRHELDVLLTAMLVRPRALARAFVNLSRCLLHDAPPAALDDRQEALRGWFADHVADVGRVLVSQKNESLEVIQLALATSFSATTAVRYWSQLAMPWVTEYPRSWVVGRAFMSALAAVPPGEGAAICEALLSTPQTVLHGALGHRLLGRALEIVDLPSETHIRLRLLAFQWLKRNDANVRSGMLLRALAAQPLPDDDRALAAVTLRWIEGYRSTDALWNVLATELARRGDLEAKDADALAGAVVTAGARGGTIVTDLAAVLLGNPSVRGYRLDRLCGIVLGDLARRDWHEQSLLLQCLFDRSDVSSNVASSIVDGGLTWLHSQSDPASPRLSYVLTHALQRREIGIENAAALLAFAERWLTHNIEWEDASFVLVNTLVRSDVPRDMAARVVALAIQWLRATSKSALVHRALVLRALLTRTDLGEVQAAEACGHAVDWLAENIHARNAAPLLGSLLSRRELSEDDGCRLIDAIGDQIDQADEEGTTAAIVTRLIAARRGAWFQERSATLGTEWLRRHRGEPDASLVFGAMLARTDLDAATIESIVESTVDWLVAHADTHDLSFLVGRLLDRPEVVGEIRARVESIAVSWVRTYLQTAGASFMLYQVLGRMETGHDLVRDVIACAIQWLGDNSASEDVSYVLARVLGRDEMDADQAAHVTGFALDWLDQRRRDGVHDDEDSSYVLGRLLQRHDDAGDGARAIDLGISWLEGQPLVGNRHHVLGPLLRHPGLSRDVADVTINGELDYLESSDGSVLDINIVGLLLERVRTGGDSWRRLSRLALRWLNGNLDDEQTPFAFYRILGGPPVDSEVGLQATQLAVDWLRRRAESEKASYVLGPLLGRGELTGHDAEWAVTFALEWLDLHPDEGGTPYVLSRLLARSELAGERASKAIRITLDWLDGWLPAHAVGDPGQEDMRDGGTSVLASLFALPDVPRAALFNAVEQLITLLTTSDDHRHLVQLLQCLLTLRTLTIDRRRRTVAFAHGSKETVLEFALVEPLIVEALVDHPLSDATEGLVKAVMQRGLLNLELANLVRIWITRSLEDSESAWRLMQLFVWTEREISMGSDPSQVPSLGRLVAEELLLADRILHCDLPTLNHDGAVDVMVSAMSKGCRTGLWAAQADDLVARWIGDERAFSRVAPGTPNLDVYVRRIGAVALTGRIARSAWPSLIDRLETWAASWPDPDMSERANGHIALFRSIANRMAGPPRRAPVRAPATSDLPRRVPATGGRPGR